MADPKIPIYLVKSAEGSKPTNDPDDMNAKDPSPFTCIYKGKEIRNPHTVKGVAYSTFRSLAPKYGYAVTAENFCSMPDDIWTDIWTEFYSKSGAIKLDSQAIADYLGNSYWGNPSTYINFLKQAIKDLGYDVPQTKEEIITFVNGITSDLDKEYRLFNRFIDVRIEALAKNPKYAKGWIDRAEKFRKHGNYLIREKMAKRVWPAGKLDIRYMKAAMEHPKNAGMVIAASSVAVVGLAFAGYAIYRHYSRKK